MKEQNQRVIDAADRKRANHGEWLRQESNRRNRAAKAEAGEGLLIPSLLSAAQLEHLSGGDNLSLDTGTLGLEGLRGIA